MDSGKLIVAGVNVQPVSSALHNALKAWNPES
jgi:hypothetical protein